MAHAQFGPYPYRANGAQYLNLVWPVSLGFWWALQRVHRAGGRPTHHVLLACVLMIVVGPITSLSRAGAAITAGAVALSAGVLLLDGLLERSVGQKLVISLVLMGAVAGGLAVQWTNLAQRMKSIEHDYESRERVSRVGRVMARDNPVFGFGADTLQPVYQLYKGAAQEYWPGQLHNDWLETRVCFGWAGLTMILAALGVVVGRWFCGGGGMRASWRFVSFFWIALAGCLIHARWDFPLQVYSIVLVVVVYCAVLVVTGKIGDENA
jgi:hypothetical protein